MIPFISTDLLTTELIFINSHTGIINVKHVQRTDWKDESKETKEYIYYDMTTKFRYSFNTISSSGKFSCVLDFKGTLVESRVLERYIFVNDNFQLFHDNDVYDVLWLKDMDKIFLKIQ